MIEKYTTTNTTALAFNAEAKGDKVIFDHPIAELFNNSHTACPTTYKSADISTNEYCKISATYPFPVSCSTNVEAGYNQTLTLSFEQHSEPKYSITVKVSQAASPSSGGGATWVIIAVIAVIVLAVVGYFCYKNQNKNKTQLIEDEEEGEGLKQQIM